MYLKSLKLTGFKSFADRTRLELRPGVTVVVGPNGSGKSNLVDAVSWVMGTQSTKNLRTGKMEDVVFAGTATRPALNRAEVTLVFDNETRTLPLDLDEVSITRRLYRDGSSDYELNGVDCRLLDVQELLSDSGVGRTQHVIVGQGQIDKVLNSGPGEHRAVIEEAAGILKHRQRKERAIRRLERTDSDLVRLNDLLTELGRQMRPLKRQANAAEKHADLAQDVKALRLFLGGERLRRLDARAGSLNTERGALGQSLSDGEATVADLAAALNVLSIEAGEVGAELDRDTSAAARLETILERLRRSASVAHERRRAAQGRREGAAERRRDLTDELDQIAAEIVTLESAVGEAAVEAERAERRFRALEDEARSLADQDTLTPEGALAVVRGEARALEATKQRDARERESVDRRLVIVTAQREGDAGERNRLNQEIRTLDDATSVHQSAYDEATERRRADQVVWDAAETERSDARLGLASARARLDALNAAVEGLADPQARAVVERAAGHRGTIAALLDVPPELAAAVDAALGPWADASAFDTAERLEDAVRDLKSAGRGGVPVVVVQHSGGCAARSVAEAMGVDALIDRLGEGADRAVAERMLGDVILVEGWAAAWHIVAQNPSLRAVTPEGDLVSVFGVRIAHPDGATPAMVETAGVAVERSETELARIESRHSTSRRDFERSRDLERQALELLEESEARLAGATEALARLGRSEVALAEEEARLQERSAALLEADRERDDSLERLGSRIAALEGEEAERQAMWEEMEQRRVVVEADREQARANWQERSADHRGMSETLTLLQRRRSDIDTSLEHDLASPVTDLDLDRLEAVESVARSAMVTIDTHLETLRKRQAELRERAGATGIQRASVRRRHEAMRTDVEGFRRRLGEVEVESTEVRVRRENACEALRREADADEGVALAAPRPLLASIDIGEEADLEPVLDDLHARLQRMGPINPLAAIEYAELGERHTFLTDQLDDLQSSRNEVRGVISALDDEIQERFATAYEEVRVAYEQNFAILFPGGSGSLGLSEPDEPLTSGIEIKAQPLGKRVSRMTLLSGGERSLAALAFLFAIFKARPSPFYILDEVEAALDDANLRRFLTLADAFRESAQLVIITHQQQTMETANVLYGVTMEPGGSSSVVRKEIDTVQVRSVHSIL